MNIDKSSFFLLVTTIGASAAGGWFARDRLLLRSEVERSTPPSAQPEPAPPPSASAPPASSLEAPAPSCDDEEGTVPDCVGFPDPGDEAECRSLVYSRCAQYKESLKPKAARAAVECLKRLKVNQVCDLIAINKCGHEALMASCPVAPTKVGSSPTEIDQTCEKILTSCKDAKPGPTPTDCRQTLSGLNPTGRTKMVACMQKLCDARGLYGCEAR